MAMYRSESSVTNRLSSFNTPNGFGTSQAQYNPNFNHGGSLNQVTDHEALSNRIDQLFGMITSTQQGLTAKLQLELSDLQKKYSDLEDKITQFKAYSYTCALELFGGVHSRILGKLHGKW